MEITELIWKLFILMLPGVVSTLILRQISTNKNYPVFEFILYSALLGIFGYIFMELLYSLWNILLYLFCKDRILSWGVNLSVWDNIFGSDNLKYNELELIFSYIASIPIGMIIGIAIKKKLILNICRRLKVTNRFGDEDIWTYFLCDLRPEWIDVRDERSDCTYCGYIIAYSDSAEKREILLGDVSVYKYEEGKMVFRYKVERLYLELDSFKFTLETRKEDQDGEKVAVTERRTD